MSRARDLADGTFSGEFAADSPTLVVDATNNRVGVGTTSPEGQLHLYSDSVGAPAADADDFVIEKTGDTGLSILSTTTGRIYFGDAASNDQGSIRYVHTDNSMRFETDSAERMRIDGSGNLLVGTTNSTPHNLTSGGGLSVRGPINLFSIARQDNEVMIVNRTGTGGNIALFRYNGATVGSIGTDTNDLYVASANTHSAGLWFNGASALGNQDIRPCNSSGAGLDNVIDLGDSAYRFDDIYATNGTIQTSDRNEKQDIEALSDAEQRVAVAAKGLLRKYRWKGAVAEKGDAARIHFGIIAQDLQAAFEAEGLDAGRYGMFISSTWWEADRVIPAVAAQDAVYETQLDEDGNEVQVLVSEAIEAQPERVVTDTFDTLEEAPEGAVQRTRLGVRYPELLAFIIAAL